MRDGWTQREEVRWTLNFNGLKKYNNESKMKTLTGTFFAEKIEQNHTNSQPRHHPDAAWDSH